MFVTDEDVTASCINESIRRMRKALVKAGCFTVYGFCVSHKSVMSAVISHGV